MSGRYDAIVVGLGGMGSAALAHIAGRGRRVLGLEQFDVPHDRGSSHGLTRIIRLAYFERTEYVPLLRRAYELWRELEAGAGERLLHLIGCVVAGGPDSEVIRGVLRSCARYDLAHELLDAGRLRARFPGYRVPPETVAILEREAGFLVPEACVVAHVGAARARGAEVRTRERVLDWTETSAGVRVRTDAGTYEAERLVLTAGAWISKIARLPNLLAAPERQVVAWFEPRRPELFAPERFPVFVLDTGDEHLYGFPAFGVPGFKIGLMHHLRERVDPDDFEREARPDDERLLRERVERYFPEAAGPTLRLETCLFTNSPDLHFILDRHPEAASVVVATGFSGHGFKFCTVVGEILAELALDGATRHDVDFLGLGRFDRDARYA